MNRKKLCSAFAVLLMSSACGGVSSEGSESPSTEELGAVEQRALCHTPAAWYDGYAMFSNSSCGDADFAADAWMNGGSNACSAGSSGCYLTGDSWQCVEWAERYFWFKWDVRGFYAGNDIRWGEINGAIDMCTRSSQYYTDRRLQKLSASSTPIRGDLMVWSPGVCGADPTWGHVAVVTSVGSTSVGVAQQNAGSNYLAPSVSRSCAACWIRATANTGTGTDEPSGSIWNLPKAAIEDARDGMITSKGKCLRRPGSVPGELANIRSCTDSTGAEQSGVRFSLNDGKLIVTSAGLCLEDIGSTNKIKSKDCTGSAEQRWNLYDMRFVNYSSNKCLDVATVAYGATVRMWTCGASDSGKQVFDWRRGDGTIRPVANTDLCVRPKDGEATAGNSLFLGSCNGDPSVWIPQSKGFVNKAAPGLSWEVDGTSNGTVVRLQPTNGSWQQKFGARGKITNTATGSCMTVFELRRWQRSDHQDLRESPRRRAALDALARVGNGRRRPAGRAGLGRRTPEKWPGTGVTRSRLRV